MVLLVVDTQKAIMNDKLFQFDLIKTNISKLIAKARSNNIEVIFVRHDDGQHSELAKGTTGFEIFDELKPQSDELIFDKTVNSAFKDSGLLQYLKRKNEKSIMIVGLQTDYCIDATIKAGFEHDFKMIVPENTNSTFSNEYMTAEETYNYYNSFIWKNRYAECVSFEYALNMLNHPQPDFP